MPYVLINKDEQVSSITHNHQGQAMAELRAFQKADPKAGWRLEYRKAARRTRRMLARLEDW